MINKIYFKVYTFYGIYFLARTALTAAAGAAVISKPNK